MATIPVKFYTNQMYGAPSIANNTYDTAGKIVEVLDAVLVNGFGLVTVDSIAVASNIATITRSAGLGNYIENQVIEIAGVTSPSALNGQWRVLDKPDGNSLRVAVSGISDQSASGTMTIKTPSLGWEIVWSSGNLRVYRSQDVDSPRSYYRFDDVYYSNGTYTRKAAHVRAFTTMTDQDTGFNEWGTTNLNIGWARIHDSNNPCRWYIIGDTRTVYQNSYQVSYLPAWTTQVMGDYVSFMPGDTDNELLQLAYPGQTNQFGCNAVSPTHYDPRTASLSDMRRMRRGWQGNYGLQWNAVRTANDLSGYGGFPWPTSVNNQIIVTDALVREIGAGGDPIKGRLRGAYHLWSDRPMAAQAEFQLIEGVIGLEGRKTHLLYEESYNTGNARLSGRILFDITGPWD